MVGSWFVSWPTWMSSYDIAVPDYAVLGCLVICNLYKRVAIAMRMMWELWRENGNGVYEMQVSSDSNGREDALDDLLGIL